VPVSRDDANNLVMTYLSRILAPTLALALYTSSAHAAPTDADRAVAVRLVVEGRARFEAEQFAAALELFKRAHEIMRAPTTGLDLAKTYAALDQLIEARQVADEVVHLPVAPNEKPIFAEARADAKRAIEALDSRIPFLQLRVLGPPVQVVHVLIDGKTLTPEDVGKPYAANPGKHTIVATATDYHPTEVTVSLVESETTSVDLKLNAMVVQAPRTPPAPVVTPKNALAPAAKVGFAVGGGLAAVAIGTGIGALVMYGSTVDAVMANDRQKYEEQRGTLEGLTWTSTISGGLAVGALVYAVTRPRIDQPSKNSATSGLMVTPTVGGVVVSGVW
jgi:tetratricopeptide (TPR) repeat protein